MRTIIITLYRVDWHCSAKATDAFDARSARRSFCKIGNKISNNAESIILRLSSFQRPAISLKESDII